MGALSIFYMNRLKANVTNKHWVFFHLRSFGFHFKRVCIISYRKPKELNLIVHEKARVRSFPLVSITFDGFSFHKLS
jgi:hypothetical protein